MWPWVSVPSSSSVRHHSAGGFVLYMTKMAEECRKRRALSAEIFSYHLEHFVMNAAVTCDEFRLIDRMCVAVEVGDVSTGFTDDHGSGGHVPGTQFHLPKSIESACRNIAEIQSRAPRAPHSLGLQGEARKVIEVIVGGIADVIRKPRDRERLVKPRRP